MLRCVDDLMPIGEFSQRSGLSPKRLRSYAADGLLVPAAVDSASGYRYYSPGQFREARLIDTLREAGIPLADIAPLLRDPSCDQLDAWERRVEIDAVKRQEALDLARSCCRSRPRRSHPSTMHARGREAMTKFTTVSRTDTGRVRDNNEDAVANSDHLAAVADGMGGHPGGEVASAVAVALVQAAFTGQSLDELQAAVRAANRAIWDRADGSGELEGMGTTICAAGLTEDENARGRQRRRQPCLHVAQRFTEAIDPGPQRDGGTRAAGGAERARSARSSSPAACLPERSASGRMSSPTALSIPPPTAIGFSSAATGSSMRCPMTRSRP